MELGRGPGPGGPARNVQVRNHHITTCTPTLSPYLAPLISAPPAPLMRQHTDLAHLHHSGHLRLHGAHPVAAPGPAQSRRHAAERAAQPRATGAGRAGSRQGHLQARTGGRRQARRRRLPAAWRWRWQERRCERRDGGGKRRMRGRRWSVRFGAASNCCSSGNRDPRTNSYAIRWHYHNSPVCSSRVSSWNAVRTIESVH